MRFGTVALCALGMAHVGCGSDAPPGDPGAKEDVSQVTLAISSVPLNVSCIQVKVHPVFWGGPGEAFVTQSFSLTGGSSWSGSVGLGSFTSGDLFVSAAAYSNACASISGTTPNWVAEPIPVTVDPGVYEITPLDFRENFGVQAEGNFAPSVVSLAVNAGGTGLVLADGTVKVFGTVGQQPLLLTDVTQIGIGIDHACVVKNDGTVWCWGANDHGQVGNGTSGAWVGTPVEVVTNSPGATGIIHLSVGDHVTCAGAPYENYCWGRATPTDILSPQLYGQWGSASISTTYATTCNVQASGYPACSGDNTWGQLGDGTLVSSSTPVMVNAPVGMVNIATSGRHSCAVHTSGKVYCWGLNINGQLGTGTTISTSTPVEVPGFGSDAVEVVTGFAHTCVRSSSGAVSCVGANYIGQVGDGTGQDTSNPVVVIPGGVKKLAGQDEMNCALMEDNSVVCWGQNYGQFPGTYWAQYEPFQLDL